MLNRIEKFFEVDLLGLASGLRFKSSSYKVLRDYELGYVKEGVAAGALALVSQLQGVSCDQRIKGCEKAVDELIDHSTEFFCHG